MVALILNVSLKLRSGMVIVVPENMHPLPKRLAILCLVLTTSHQVTVAQQKSVYMNLLIDYQPAIVEPTGSSIDTLSTEIRSNMKLKVKVDKRDKYVIAVRGDGMKRAVKDSIDVESGETLIINVVSTGKCVYDLPDGAIPRCPKNTKVQDLNRLNDV